MNRRKPSAPTRNQDLPGWKESFEAAARAELKAPAGHYIRYVKVQSLRTVGIMVPPPSITFVTTPFLLCMAIGVESFRNNKRRRSGESIGGKVIDFRQAKLQRQLSRDQAEWTLKYSVGNALSAARREGDDPEEGAVK